MTKEVSERQLPAPKLPFSTSSLDLVIVKRRPAMSGNGSEGNGMGLRIFALALAAAAPSTAFAAPIAPSCPAAPVLPPELAGWSRDAAGKTIYAFGDDPGADWTSEEPTFELKSLMRHSSAVLCLQKKNIQ